MPHCSNYLIASRNLSAHRCASDVWCRRRLSVAYIGPKYRTEKLGKTKIGTETAHVTRDSDTNFKLKWSKVNLQGAEAYCDASSRAACLTSCTGSRAICARPLRMVRPSSTPYTPYAAACGAQRALLPVAVGIMNIHDVRDRQTNVRRQTASLLNASA